MRAERPALSAAAEDEGRCELIVLEHELAVIERIDERIFERIFELIVELAASGADEIARRTRVATVRKDLLLERARRHPQVLGEHALQH
jgi:hypothetical protein